MKIALMIGFLIGLFGCNQTNNLIELTSNQNEKGWQDVIFTITHSEKLDNGYWSLTCKAKYENNIVGLKINIIDEIPPGLSSDGVDNRSFAPRGVEFQSIGLESDKLLEALSQLYEQPLEDKFTEEKLAFTAFPLNEERAILKNGRFHFKLFFDENNKQNLYSEIFLNPDLKNGTVELNEKDEEYRSNIIRLLSKNKTRE